MYTCLDCRQRQYKDVKFKECLGAQKSPNKKKQSDLRLYFSSYVRICVSKITAKLCKAAHILRTIAPFL